MHTLVMQGKILYWGTSEWRAQEIEEAHAVARREHLTPPTMEQPQYNFFVSEKVEGEFLPLYEKFGMGTTTWSPLASGLLTGKYNDGMPQGTRVGLRGYEWLRERFTNAEAERKIEVVRKLGRIAGELGISTAELALAWCLKNPHVSTVITGATRPEQVQENLKAGEAAAKVGPDVWEQVAALT